MTTLLCTVGGSHEPILAAIREVQPDHVIFICSEDDATTGRLGSHTQITKNGNAVMKKNVTDEKATLPNIPAQLGWGEDQYTVIRVEADEIDDVYSTCVTAMHTALEKGETVIADYTGGTKTMSAGLVAAALDTENILIQLVTGGRENLRKIQSGTEQAQPASVENTRVRRRIHEYTKGWEHYAYAESHQQLKALRIGAGGSKDLRGELNRARDLSHAFALWDRFEHTAAKTELDRYRPMLARDNSMLYQAIDMLAKDDHRREPARLFDLWRNAQRRAAQHRYDDAIARLYRLTEWSAQWILNVQTGILTANVPPEKIPEGITLTRNLKGEHQAGLLNAWSLAAHWGKENVSSFWELEQEQVLNHTKARNQSILAHGFTPINEKQWVQYSQWVEQKLLPLLISITNDQRYKIRQVPPQLATEFTLRA